MFFLSCLALYCSSTRHIITPLKNIKKYIYILITNIEKRPQANIEPQFWWDYFSKTFVNTTMCAIPCAKMLQEPF